MLREALERHLVDLGLDLGGGAVKAPSSPRKSGGHPSVGNLGRRGEEGYSPEKSRSPSFVSAFFHHFPRGTDPPRMIPPTPASSPKGSPPPVAGVLPKPLAPGEETPGCSGGPYGLRA